MMSSIRLPLSPKACNILQRQLRFAQKTNEWLHARHALLTSSDVAAALECNKYQSSLELLKRKCSALGDNRLQSNESIRWGELFEPIARDVFQAFKPEVFAKVYADDFTKSFSKGENNHVVECNLVVHNTYKWLGASPDGVLLNGKLLEIKCPYRRTIRQGLIPHAYWIQVQMQLEVCDVDEAYFFQCKFDNGSIPFSSITHSATGSLPNKSYWGLRAYTLDVIKRDRKWFAESIPKMEQFWNNVLHYRIVGLAKLMNDVGSRTAYYNLQTGQIEHISNDDIQWVKHSLKPLENEQMEIDIMEIEQIDVSNLHPPEIEQRENNIQESPVLISLPLTLDGGAEMMPELNLNSQEPESPDYTIENDMLLLYQSNVKEVKEKEVKEKEVKEKEVKEKEVNNDSTDSIQPQLTDMSPVFGPSVVTPIRDWSQWVYATATHNYAKHDPLIDWLNEYGRGEKRITTGNPMYDSKISDYENDNQNNVSFFQYIRAKGVEFEEQVVEFLYRRFPTQIVTSANPSQARSISKYKETINLMAKGTPIIYQAVLHEEQSKTYGMADLIVRSDFINQIFKRPALSIDQLTHGCKFNRRWHYVVIDIKNAKLYLASDGVHLINSGSMPAYKSQVWVYNHAVGVIQEYCPPCGFILGNKWEYTKCNETYYDDGWFDRAGTIDYEGRDANYKEIAKCSIEWIRNVRHNGHSWSISPPSKEELYPNMKNHMDNPWHSTKKTISDDIGDITLIWNCGIKQRSIAHAKGITSWHDPRCTAEAMGIKGKATAPIVDAFLAVNRGNDHYIPKKIKHKLPRYKVEIFMDFETVNSLVEPIENGIPTTSSDRFLFMSGFGWRVNDGKVATWTYENFTTNNIDYNSNEEKKAFIAMHDRLINILTQHDALNDFIIYHWSQAERFIYDGVYAKYKRSIDPYLALMTLRWFDLLYLFKLENLVIKGTFGFGLKQVATKLHDMGYIQTRWASDGVTDGLNAMVKAMECSEDAIKRKISMKDLPLMKQIIEYNEVDCRVLLEILSFLRRHLVSSRGNKRKLVQGDGSSNTHKVKKTKVIQKL
jgi:hypothetical protein